MEIEEIIYGGFIILIILAVIGISLYFWLKPVLFGGNRKIIDTEYNFNKCITYLGNNRIEFEIESWLDFEGEQLQVKDKQGNVYLLSSFNTMLVKEIENEK